MESIKEKLFIMIGIIVFIILVGFLGYNYLLKSFTYYTQIDNTKISEVEAKDEMKYEYKLIMYDENGKSKEIKFKTSRELRESAFLKVKYYAISGVNNGKKFSMKIYHQKCKINIKTNYNLLKHSKYK